MEGKVKFFNQSKGFGFIIANDTEYFFHISGIKDNAVLKEDDVVTFDVEDGQRGPKGVNVALASEGASAPAEEPAAEEAPAEEEPAEEAPAEEEPAEEEAAEDNVVPFEDDSSDDDEEVKEAA